MKKIRIVAILALMAVFAAVGIPDSPAQAQRQTQEAVSYWRVYVGGPADAEYLQNSGYDLLEAAGDGYLFVLGEQSVAVSLRQAGFRVELDRSLDPLAPIGDQGGGGVAARAFFGGYRSVSDHYDHLTTVAATYPGLATVVDYGNSWNLINGQPGGHDLMAICLTNKQAGDCALNPNSTKPRTVIMAAIHARELQTSELAWRLIDDLTQNYNTDADITHLMNTTETWIIPVVNPDGRLIVEGGGNTPYLQRKNANDTVGNCAVPPTSSNQHGVDLNRNSSTDDWGGTGTSTDPCAQTYPGTGPASEPETQALQALFSQLWPDQKGAASSPAPNTTTGSFITIHSFGNLVLLPGGPTGGTSVAPNDAELRAFGFRMSHFNGYQTGTGAEILYGTTGTTDDFVYYDLGVPGFTYEVSPSSGTCSGFTPAYSCVDSTLWPLNRDALLYAIRVAKTPYLTSRGPSTTSVTAPASVDAGNTLNVTAVVNDNTLGNAGGSFGRPTAQTILAAQYFLDASDLQGGTPVTMTASDGSFNATTETVTAAIPTTGLSTGRHTLFVRAQNAAGFWGPVRPVFFDVVTGVDDPPVANGQTLSGALNTALPITLTGTDPEGQPLTFAVTSTPANGTITGTAPNLIYTPNTGFVGSNSFTFTVNDGALTSAPATVSITVTDPSNGPVFVDDFETDKGWQTNSAGTDTATLGQWQRAVPQATNSGGPKQLATTTSGSQVLVTAAAAGASVGVNDVDNGVTTIRSPQIALPNAQTLTLTFDYYMAHTTNATADDYFRVSVVGSTTQVVLEELGAANNDDGAWQRATIDLSAYRGQNVRLLISAADAAAGSIVEASVDTLSIVASTGTNTPPTANSQSVPTLRNQAVPITLTGSDANGDPLTYTIVNGPTLGTLSGSGQTRTYTPNTGVTGTDTFTFVTNDGTTNSAAATVTVTINPGPGIVFQDDFEVARGWVANPAATDTATSGRLERGVPQATNSAGPKQLATATSGASVLVTGALAGASAATNDLDGGVTTIQSPAITLPTNLTMTATFSYYFAHRSNSSSADFLEVAIVGPTSTQVLLLETGAADNDDAAWQAFSGQINAAFVGQTVVVRVRASDAPSASLVEAALDDFVINAQ